MTIIANFDDINPTISPVPTSATPVYGTDYGAFGVGVSAPSSDWYIYRINSTPLEFSLTMPKRTVSVLVRIRQLGSNPINIIGCGFIKAGTSIDSTVMCSALLDGRNTQTTGSTSAAFQMRAGTINSGGVVYSQASGSTSISSGIWYRVELDMEPDNGSIKYTARWYIHGTNVLRQTSTAYTAAYDNTVTTVYPGIVVYGGGSADSLQLTTADDPYVSNVPAKVWTGTEWVRKALKKFNGTSWVPMFPKVFKTNQWLW